MKLLALIKLLPAFILYSSLQDAVFALPKAAPVQGTTSAAEDPSFGFIGNFLDDAVDTYINNVLKDWNSPGGLGIAFVRRDPTGKWINIEAKGYGKATGRGTNVTGHTYFNIASNTKQFVALSVGKLIANQSVSPALDWKTPIKTIIPEYGYTDPVATEHANIIDLFSHRTGYTLHDLSYTYADTPSTVIGKLSHQRQFQEFRDGFLYNNQQYIVLSEVVQRKSGIPMPLYVKQNIFDPLGMKESTFSYKYANATGQAADGMARQGIDPYTDPFGGNSRSIKYWLGYPQTDEGNFLAGPGGILITPADLTKYIRCQLSDGKHPDTGVQIIAPGLFDQISGGISVVEFGLPPWPEYSSQIYGTGQLQYAYRGHNIIEHGGFIRGFNGQFSRLPNDGIGVAVLSNDNEHGMALGESVKNYLLDKALNLPHIDWSTRYKQQRAQQFVLPRATARPSNPAPSVTDWSNFSGVYSDPGYGSLEFCQINPPVSTQSQSAVCQAATANLNTVLPGVIHGDAPTYIAYSDRPIFQYMRLTHFDGPVFNVSVLISNPTNDPALPYWTYGDLSTSDNSILAEFEINSAGQLSFGISGIWGIPVKPQGPTIRDRAEAYFVKA